MPSYEKVRYGCQVVSCAVLVAIGIDPQGKRSILCVTVSLLEGLTGVPTAGRAAASAEDEQHAERLNEEINQRTRVA